MKLRRFRLASAVGLGTLIAAAGLFPAGAAQAAQVTCTPSAGFTTCIRFTYSGGQQSFTVPDGVTSLAASLLGADGASGPARGGQATGTVAVTPGQTLTVTVGQAGGAFGGGGPGAGVPSGCSELCGTDGGGMSALWNGAPNVAENALLIAGGAGGTGGRAGAGGVGGGLTGGAGAGGSGGGTQTQGGAGGPAAGCAVGSIGRQFRGGGGAGGPNGGGGGGGGWYGGGGGHCGQHVVAAGSGGGGSSYVGGPGVTDGTTTAGANAAGSYGVVTLQYNLPVPTSLFDWPVTLLVVGLVLVIGLGVWFRRTRSGAATR